MEVNDIVEHIFGTKCRLPDHPQDLPDEKLYCLDWVNQWVSKSLMESGGPSPVSSEIEDKREGRIGPRIVRFDIVTHVGLFIVGADRLSLHSQSNFSTIRANVCLYKGKWQYEIQLGSKGVMQIGWATSSCKFSQEIGVGDTINSYAYDGNRIRKWNVSTYKYGEPWLSGDIIGCTIDLDRGTLEFFRNGRSLGEAFDNIQIGPGMAYFPSVSLAFTENLVANFGATPLRYPVEGYEPIQEAPTNDFIKAEQLTNWLMQLLNLYDRKYELFSHIHSNKSSLSGSSSANDVITHQALLMGLSRILIHPLATLLLTPYVTEACLVPFLQNLCGVENAQDARLLVANKRKLMVFLDMLWAFLEEFEIQRCFEALIACLLSNFRHVSFVLEYPHQKKSLLLLIYLTQHPRTRKHLLEHVLFDKVRFANFVHVKPLDEGGLAEVVNTPWWETITDEKIKQAYNASCQRIKESIAHIETLQVELLKTLLDNTDGSPTSPSSRKIFLRKFRLFLHEHAVSSRARLHLHF